METKERRRRASTGKASKSDTARRRRTSAAGTDTRRRKTTSTPTNRDIRKRKTVRRRQEAVKQPQASRRIVRPPQEDIPEVIYTAPKPLRRGKLAMRLLSMAAVVAAVFLGLSVFFRVETVTVAGADKYTPWMVMQASGISEGDALLGISEARVASRIIAELPYVDEVKLGIQLPGTVAIEIKELQVTYAIEAEDGSWWLISSSGRAVEQVTFAQASGYTRIEGLAIKNPTKDQAVEALPGKIIDPGEGTSIDQDQSDADQQLAALIDIMQGLERNRVIGEVSVIDMTDIQSIKLQYPQLLTVLLGDEERMDYKLSYMASAMSQLAKNQSGELDLSLEYTEDAVFSPSR